MVNNNNIEHLYHHNLVEQNYNYGSIERKSIISFFKKNTLRKKYIFLQYEIVFFLLISVESIVLKH